MSHEHSSRSAITRAQEWVRSFVPEEVSLVDELIAERRCEAAAEAKELGELTAPPARRIHPHWR